MAQEFIEVSVVLPHQFVDAVSAFISENIATGLVFEENESNTIVKFYIPSDNKDSYNTKLDGYFQNLKELHTDFKQIPTMSEKVIENIQWENAYKESVQAVLIADDISVRPPWKEKPNQAIFDIVIEPKMAFGTGSHETTRSCLAIIRKTVKASMTFLDMGCGSGILSILADQLKVKSIKAIDYDLISTENTIENFELNNVTTPYQVLHGSIEHCQNDKAYDYVCANMIKNAILPMLDKLCSLTKPSGVLVLSGLLAEDLPEIEKVIIQNNMSIPEIVADNEWRSLVMRKLS